MRVRQIEILEREGNVVHLPPQQRVINGKLSFDELSESWSRLFGVLEAETEYLVSKGLNGTEIREVFENALNNQMHHTMVDVPDA